MMYPDWKRNEDDQESDYNELDEEFVSSENSPYTSSDDEIYEDRYENTNMIGESLQKESVQAFITSVKILKSYALEKTVKRYPVIVQQLVRRERHSVQSNKKYHHNRPNKQYYKILTIPLRMNV